jgi:serine phosphatase RsbU (regulator of sigma subunit)
MLTDGMIDQNGPDRKRYGSVKFEELIMSMENSDMDQEKEIFIKSLSDFMKEEVQRDDITLIGIKVK